MSYAFEPKYKRNNGIAVFDVEVISLSTSFKVHETSLVRLAAGQIAGNHKHPRQEAYLCLDEGILLYWVDIAGKVHTEQMKRADSEPRLFIIPSFVPHAIINTTDRDVTLLGYADSFLEAVEPVSVTN